MIEMPTLNKLNAKNHCRTCLIKINLDECQNLDDTNNDPIAETKDISISIAGNNELQSFISTYASEERFNQSLDQFPQHVCLDCFKLIQQVDKFLAQVKASAETLHKLLSVAKEEIQREELHEENKDIDRLLLKDSLLEIESVLLNNTSQNNEATIKADPFNEDTVLKNNDTISSQSSDFSCDDNEWEANSTDSNWSETISKEKRRSTRNNNSKKGNSTITADKEEEESKNPISDDNNEFSEPLKKKRRSKQEMQEYRRQQQEKREKNPIQYKRRPKGTKNKFKCKHCEHRFAHQLTLDVHIRKVHEGNPRPYLCEHCPKTYVALTGLTSHLHVAHSKERRKFICELPGCNRTYTCLMGLQNHKRVKHTDPNKLRKFVCEKCGDTFCKGSLLIYHRRAKHPTEAEKAKKSEVFQCDICQKTLATKHSLKYHKMQQHSGEMKYKCEICGQKLAQKSSVEYHRLLHSTEKIPCKDCNKQFVRVYDLRKHIRVVHMKLKPYKCSYCPESFASNKTMKHHEYTHTGEKPYVCNICSKSYRQPTCLKNHLKTHEKPTPSKSD